MQRKSAYWTKADGGFGLVDLDRPSRRIVTDIIADARAESLGVNEVVARLRDKIPAGPWRTAAIRARVIARTEIKHAQTDHPC